MADENKKKSFKLDIAKLKKENWDGDRVLRFAVIVVIVLFIIGGIIVGLRVMNPRVDATEGQEKLEKLEDVNVQTIDSQIKELEASEAEEAAAWKAKSASEKLSECVVLGDGIAQGFNQNEVLSKSLVKASENAAVYDAEGTGLSEVIENTIAAEPEKVFLYLGRADAANGNENVDTFITNYQKSIQQLKSSLPNTSIYVCSIPEVKSISTVSATGAAQTDTTSQTTVNISNYKVIPTYNDALKSLCKTERVRFIDQTDLTDDEYYGEDGITMTEEYYEACINKIVEAAFRRYVI